MASYNEIVSILNQFATAHYQIKAFGNGEMDELVETFSLKDAEYPKMWANDQPNTTATGEETFKFRIYMVDQVATLKQKTDTTLGESNINEVKSNTRQMCLDLVSFLIQNTIYPEITTDRNIQLTSFVDSFNDKLTGWYFDLDIRQALSFSACVIPMDGITPPPSATCEPSIISINGTFFINVPSGSTEDITVKDTNGLVVGGEVGGEWIVPPAGGVCDDAVEIIRDTSGNELYNNSIPSGDTEIQVIADSTVTNSDVSYNVNILAEGSLVLPDVINIDSDGTPTPTPAQTVFTCTPAVSYPISYVRDNGRYQPTQFLTHDLRWYLNNTSYFVYTVVGVKPVLDPNDETKLLTLNAFGNLNRVTNDLGFSVYNGSDGSTANYLVDHYTGLGWYLLDIYIGNNNWVNNNIMMQTFTYGGYSDFRFPNREDINQISTTDGSTTILTGFKTFSKFLHYLLDAGTALSITFWWEGNVYLNNTRFSTTNPNTNFSNVSSIACRNHY